MGYMIRWHFRWRRHEKEICKRITPFTVRCHVGRGLRFWRHFKFFANDHCSCWPRCKSCGSWQKVCRQLQRHRWCGGSCHAKHLVVSNSWPSAQLERQSRRSGQSGPSVGHHRRQRNTNGRAPKPSAIAAKRCRVAPTSNCIEAHTRIKNTGLCQFCGPRFGGGSIQSGSSRP